MKSCKHLLVFWIFIITLIGNIPYAYSFDNSLKTFETDGCTLFIDGPPRNSTLWRHCCVEHDLRYWFGGNVEDRNLADTRLKSCVESVAGTYWANIIYSGVKFGHLSPIKNKTRWNWGWREKRNYTPLTNEEELYVIQELRRLPMNADFIETFIKINFKVNYE